jgi:hypothetical protein
LTALLLVPAQTGRANAEGEAFREWQWYVEIPLPAADKAKYFDFLVPPEVLSRSGVQFDPRRRQPVAREAAPTRERQEEALPDLRLMDAKGQVVPYALRVLRSEDRPQELPASRLNPTTDAQHRITVILDLGRIVKSNAVQVVTSGSDFRRRVRLEGSNDSAAWQTIVDHADLLSFAHDNQRLVVDRIDFPTAQYHYLRVTVWPDPGKTDDRPEFQTVKAFHTIQVPGESVTLPAQLGPREAVPTPGGHGSAWTINFDKLTVPVKQLAIQAQEKEFARDYQLQQVVEEGTFQPLANGHWRREPGEAAGPLQIVLPMEVTTNQLRLVVTDGGNPPLTLTGAEYSFPAREVVFKAGDLMGPVRLYVGNPKADAPRYDFAANLPVKLEPPPVRIKLGTAPVEANPEYVPPPLPWTERYPWVVYVVLAAASLVLLAIMVALARQALTRLEKVPDSQAA